MSASAKALDVYREAFEQRQPETAQLGALAVQRKKAWSTFADRGFPSARDEDWRYTNLRRLLRKKFSVAGAPTGPVSDAAAGRLIGIADACRIVFVDGHFSRELSTAAPGAACVAPLTAVLGDPQQAASIAFDAIADITQHPFAALNTAMFSDGALIRVPAGLDSRLTVYLVFVSSEHAGAVAAHPRVLVEVGHGSSLQLIEHHVVLGAADNLVNTICEVDLQPGAKVEHFRLQDDAKNGFNIAGLHVRQGRDSEFVSRNYCLGGALTRNDIVILLEEPGARCTLNGLFMTGGNQHVDNHLRIDHLSPHTFSDQNYRGVADGRSRGVYNGKVIVHAGADKTDAAQSSKNLILSDAAEIDTKPELEIYADDVKCRHGATVGQLDADALFYLRSRGVDLETARALLTYAFAEDVVADIDIDAVRSELDARILGRLPAKDIIREFV